MNRIMGGQYLYPTRSILIPMRNQSILEANWHFILNRLVLLLRSFLTMVWWSVRTYG